MSKKYKLSELYRYRESNSDEQMAIHQMLISYVREDCRFNVSITSTSESYNLVKLTSVNFEKEAAAIWVHFETVTGEKLSLPIDFILKIERSGQKEI